MPGSVLTRAVNVSNEAARELAETVANQVPGVRVARNELRAGAVAENPLSRPVDFAGKYYRVGGDVSAPVPLNQV